MDASFDGFFRHLRRAGKFAGGPHEGGISMQRLISFAAFGFGFYYLWNNTDPTVELLGAGAMGFALLLEFISAD